MIHPVICNPVLNPLVGALDPVVWRAGSSYPAALALLWQGKFLTFNGKFLIWRL